MKYEVKSDKYTKARGGNSKFNIISCLSCKKEIFLYQKDGPGKLLRMYLDKFVAPQEFVKELKKISKKSEMKGLKCYCCGELLAVPMIYEKENRLAYRLINGKVTRKEAQSIIEIEM